MTKRETMLLQLQEVWDLHPDMMLGELVVSLAEGRMNEGEVYEGTASDAEDCYLSEEMDRVLEKRDER